MRSEDPYTHLDLRCKEIIARYIDPTLNAEEAALEALTALPDPDLEGFAIARLLAHAELEDYFETKATLSINKLDAAFSRDQSNTAQFASLIFFYLWRKQRTPPWLAGASGPRDENADLKTLAQESLGFARQFIKENNGIKEASVHALSVFMGFFPDELDDVLVQNLNQFGVKRGDVAHKSWMRETRTFDSATLEKQRITDILTQVAHFYEAPIVTSGIGVRPGQGLQRRGRMRAWLAKLLLKVS